MGNNQEIRKRMETYRSILLVINWIVAVVLIIVGFVLVNSRYTQGIGIGVIIGSVVIGVIGHFLINVALAIPFILLNNGDYLAAIVPEGKHIGINNNGSKSLAQDGISDNNKSLEEMPCDDNHWICGRCKTINESTVSKCKKCGW